MTSKEKSILDELYRNWNLARSAFYKNPNKTTERKMDSALLQYLKERDKNNYNGEPKSK